MIPIEYGNYYHIYTHAIDPNNVLFLMRIIIYF